VGHLEITQGDIWSVAVRGDYAYLADTINGIRIVDISDKANPQEVSIYGPGHGPKRVFIRDNYLFVSGIRINGLNILDISVPAAPVIIASIPNTGEINDVEFGDSLLFIASGQKGLLIYDIKNIIHPDYLSSFKEGPLCLVNGVAVVGQRAYLADNFQAFRILDISRLDALRQVAFVPMPGPVSDIFFKNDRAYLSCGYAGLFIYDVYKPNEPLEIGSFVDDSTQGYKIEVCSGNLLCVADLNNSFYIVDTSPPNACRKITSFATNAPVYGFCVEGEYIYLAAGQNGMYILEYK
jgi:hypothetical protein